MCGIVGAVSERNILPILLEGLQKLEYRGYDSAGVVVIDDEQNLNRKRTLKKVNDLKIQSESMFGKIGIAHTRWATHGVPSEVNAHPHLINNRLAIVHNGILENYSQLKDYCTKNNCTFVSETDTEVILQLLSLIMKEYDLDVKSALKKMIPQLKGSYALAIIDREKPNELIAIRYGSPLVISCAFGEYFVSSDASAVSFVSQQYIILQEGDIATLQHSQLLIENIKDKVVYDSSNSDKNERELKQVSEQVGTQGKGEYRHYMHKEIHEQPIAITETLSQCIFKESLLIESFGLKSKERFSRIKRVQIIACGTSYHAGMIFRYWCEDIVKIPVNVEVASEFRYRNPIIEDNTLFICISQSGETADTIAALKLVSDLKKTKKEENDNWPILAICNKADSTLVNLSDLVFLTHAGAEVGVASTKAFTTQLIALSVLMLALGKAQNYLDEKSEKRIIKGLKKIPQIIEKALKQENEIIELANIISTSSSVIFLGRGTMFPVALEGALKLKEISYIHAEAFPSGELKHGPLALVDENIPVIVVAPNNELIGKLKSNLEEVSARGGKIYVFEDKHSKIKRSSNIKVITIAENIGRISSPIIFTIPLQLLAYHVALVLGTDIDQPRNLAKSVTVE